MKHSRKTAAIAAAFIMSAASAFPAYAASIKTVDISIDSAEDDAFQVGAMTEAGLVEVDCPSGKYHVADYGFLEPDGTVITNAAPPQLRVTLEADDSEDTFSLTKASEVHLTGDTKPEYVSGAKQEDGTQLVVTVNLTSLGSTVGTVEYAQWSDKNPGSADILSYGGTAHQIQLYRNGKKFGKIIDVPKQAADGDFEFPLDRYLLGEGKYTFEVRQYDEKGYGHLRGKWTAAADSYTVTGDMAAQNRAQYGYESNDGYGWQKDDTGWRYKTPGGYPANQWVKDNGHWFHFGSDGYMQTGWQLVDGKWYCMNASGEMYADTTTPDGYMVGADGAWVG